MKTRTSYDQTTAAGTLPPAPRFRGQWRRVLYVLVRTHRAEAPF